MGIRREADVKRLSTPGRHPAGNGLSLLVASGGSKSWAVRVGRGDRGLGGWPAVTLKQARQLAEQLRVAVRAGADPKPVKVVKVSAVTVREAGAAVLSEKQRHSRLGTERSALQWRQRLDFNIYPVIGDKSLADVTAADLLGILEGLWIDKHETARKLVAQLYAIFAWAEDFGHVKDSPMDAVQRRIKRWSARPATNHHRALESYADVGAVLKQLRGDRKWYVPSTAAIAFAVFTAARSGEVRGATWGEFDRKARTWTIPADRMKASRPHRVPLSIQASVLVSMRRPVDASDEDFVWPLQPGDDDLVFPSRQGKMLSDNSLSKRLRDAGVESTVHGFRSSFRDWCAATGAPRDVAELSLAHVVGGATERAYFRSDLLDQRRELMQAWADFIAPTVFSKGTDAAKSSH